MPRSRDTTVSCSCREGEDEDDFNDQSLGSVNFMQHHTPPTGYHVPDSYLGPEVGSPMNISGFVMGSPQSPVTIPSIDVDMRYDGQGRVVPGRQQYTEAEEDFLNRTIQTPESQGRQSPESPYAYSTPPGFQYNPGRKAGLWDNTGASGACGGGSPCSKSSESPYAIDTPPGFQYKPGRKAGSWGNASSRESSGARQLSFGSPAQRSATRVQRPRAQQPSLIPVPFPRGERSSYMDEDPAPAYEYTRPAKPPVNFMQRNIDNLQRYPDPNYMFVPKHKFPGKPPEGTKRRSEPVRLRGDIDAEDLDVSDIPLDSNMRPFKKYSEEPMVAGMISHMCANRGWPKEIRKPATTLNESIYEGRFANPSLEQADTFIRPPPRRQYDHQDDDIQVLYKQGSRPSNPPAVSPELGDIAELPEDRAIFERMEKRVMDEVSDDVVGDDDFLDPNATLLSVSQLKNNNWTRADVSEIEQLVQEENNEVSMAVDLSLPSRVNTTFGRTTAYIPVSPLSSGPPTPWKETSTWGRTTAYVPVNSSSRHTVNVSAAVSSPSPPRSVTTTWGRTTAEIPVMAEGRDVDHVFAANMTMVQEQGLSLTSPPHHITNLLFPLDEGECQITAILDAVRLDGAIVPMRPSRIRLPPATPEKMDELAVIADSFIRSAPDRAAAAQLNVTLGTNLNVSVVPTSPDETLDESAADGSPGGGGRAAASEGRPDPMEASRSIGAINAGRLVNDTDFVMDGDPVTGTWIQLRGHRPPNWFPGYYASLPSLPDRVTLMRTASEVLPRAWYAVQSDSFQEEHHMVF